MIQIIRRRFSSIAFKITGSLAAMGVATGAAVIVGLLVFASLGASVQSLMSDGIPRIASSLNVIAGSRAARDALASVTLASDAIALDQARERFGMALDGLHTSVAEMDSATASALPQMVDDFGGAVDRMGTALSERFSAEAKMISQIQDFQDLATATSETLTELSDTAFFDLSIGGENTVTTVRGALETLTEEEFGLMQAILGARADLNLVTSLALAVNAEQDVALSAIMRDIITAAFDRMNQALTLLKDNNRLADSEEALVAARDELGQLVKAGLVRRPGLSERLLSLRQESDAALEKLIDDQSFALAIMASDRAAENDVAIRKLVDTDVGRLRETSQIEIAVQSLFVTALLGAAAQDTAAVEAAQAALTEKARAVAANTSVNLMTPDLGMRLDRIISFADAEDGLLATRRTYLDAVITAATLSRDASEQLTLIAATAQDQGAEAMQAMVLSGDAVLAETTLARSKMLLIGGISAALLLLSPVLMWLWIIAPMGRVTRVTERLATGDLAPVIGFERTGGEIGRMAGALRVFRDGLIDREAMQVQEREREARDRSAALAAEEAERAAEADARAEQARRDAQDRARDDAARARQDELERVAQTERDARAAEQALVVTSLAKALQQLAAGDLTAEISTPFAGSYEDLRRDFNATVGALAATLREVVDNAGSIKNGAQDISSTADGLSRRTESTAATLQNTALAMDQLTSSVGSSARLAIETDASVAAAKSNAEFSGGVIVETVAAMDQIAESSTKITAIVKLIDDIAFQTNLLALNAGVEAARAGDSGRGFAVVASEVRALAQRTSEAASDIGDLIAQSGHQVSKGVQLVDRTGSALREIVASVSTIAGQVSDIAASAKQQSMTLADINSDVTQLDQSTQQNAARLEETTAASEILTKDAVSLVVSLERFNLRVAGADQAVSHPTRSGHSTAMKARAG